jgi:toxin ParE1/3/4
MGVEFDSTAEKEIEQAARWYDDRVPGLGDEFVEEVRIATRKIGGFPLAYPRYTLSRSKREIRFHRVARFSYLLIYEVVREQVRIVAVAHHRSRPYYWRKRLSP